MNLSNIIFRLRLIFLNKNYAKLLILESLNNEIQSFIQKQWKLRPEGAEKAFILFLARFLDCIKGVNLLSKRNLSRQAEMLSRHALECVVYIGAISSNPSLYGAITSQEIFQRKRLRSAAAQIGIITNEEKLMMDEKSDEQIQPYANELKALADLISEEKKRRGWRKTNTGIELSINELALCSEVYRLYRTLHQTLNMSVHVFFSNLVDDHIEEKGAEELITSVTKRFAVEPLHAAITLTANVLRETDQLFGTALVESTQKRFVRFWPVEE